MGRIPLEKYVKAVVERDRGLPYTSMLAQFGLTPNQFSRFVSRRLEDMVHEMPTYAPVLREISEDDGRRSELFNMGRNFVERQCDRIMGKIDGETQLMFYEGTYFHPANIQALVYYILTTAHPELASKNRKEVIEGIKGLPKNLEDYFSAIKLGGWMIGDYGKKERCSPLAVLKAFDKEYQRRTNCASLFDLTQNAHLHEWGDEFRAPRSYWHDEKNVEKAVYHTLTENHPELASTNREEVIEGIKRLTTNLADYFYSIGLRGLKFNAFNKKERGSPLAVLKVFDKVYQRITTDTSLFDAGQKCYLMVDSRNRLVRS